MKNRNVVSGTYICYNCDEEFLVDEVFFFDLEDSNKHRISCPICNSTEIGENREEDSNGWY